MNNTFKIWTTSTSISGDVCRPVKWIAAIGTVGGSGRVRTHSTASTGTQTTSSDMRLVIPLLPRVSSHRTSQILLFAQPFAFRTTLCVWHNPLRFAQPFAVRTLLILVQPFASQNLFLRSLHNLVFKYRWARRRSMKGCGEVVARPTKIQNVQFKLVSCARYFFTPFLPWTLGPAGCEVDPGFERSMEDLTPSARALGVKNKVHLILRTAHLLCRRTHRTGDVLHLHFRALIDPQSPSIIFL